MSSNAAKTAPVHPALLSTFGPGRGSGSSEFSAWAYLTRPRPTQRNNDSDGDDDGVNSDGDGDAKLPNLVTAHANSLRIYTVLPNAGTLALTAVYDNLAGTICSLDVIPYGTGSGRQDGTQDDDDPFETSEGESSCFDGLLLGFAGHPRLSLVYPSAPMVGAVNGSSGVGTGGVLLASSIVDLTPVLNEFSMGGTSYVEQDIIVSVSTASTSANSIDPTVSVVLGGGIAIASFSLPKGPRPTEGSSIFTNSASSTWWRVASEPHVLPLASLASKVRVDFGNANKLSAASAAANTRGGRGQSGTAGGTGPILGHGFGDILDVTFLSGFSESTLLVLHTNPKKGGGRPWAGRLGRTAEVPVSSGGDDDEAEGDGTVPDTVATGTKYGLSLTAISLSVHQKRSVVLWSLLDALPADAWKLVPHPTDGVLVWGVNSIVYASSLGKIKCALAVNGFAKIGCPNGLLPPSVESSSFRSTSVHLDPNPSPLPKLSLQLEGAQVDFVTETIALVCFGNGSLHSLQFHHTDERSSPTVMSLSPLSHRVGGLGVASCLSILAKSCHKNIVKNYLHAHEGVSKEEDGGTETNSDIQARGLLFVGSRMGDCTLLAFSIKEPTLLIASSVDESKESVLESGKRKLETNLSSSESNKRSKDDDKAGDENQNNTAEIDILQQEEEDLYRDLDETDKNASASSIVSNEDSDLDGIKTSSLRRSIRSLSMCRSMIALDSLTGIGPLGPGCYGPVATCPALTENDNESLDLTTNLSTSIFNDAFSSAARHYVMPCGFGASGGVAVLTTPGRDNVGSGILGESDLCNMEGAVFGLPQSNLVLLGKADGAGAIVLRGVVNDGAEEFEEVELENKYDMDIDGSGSLLSTADVLSKTKLLAASEVSFGSNSIFSVFFVESSSSSDTPYSVVVMSDAHDSNLKSETSLKVVFTHRISEAPGLVRGEIVSITPVVADEKTKSSASFGCVWSSGHACVYSISLNQEETKDTVEDTLFKLSEWTLVGDTPEKIATKDDEVEGFYESDNIVAMDLFPLPQHVFQTQSVLSSGEKMPSTCASSSSLHDPLPSFLPDRLSMHGTWCSGHDHSKDQIHVAVCRRSGVLEIYDLSDITKLQNDVLPIWRSRGCSHGASVLAHSDQDTAVRLPATHQVEAAEIRVFVTGPSLSLENDNNAEKDAWMLRSLCILVNTSLGDLHLYSGCKRSSDLNLEFTRIPLGNVSRPSEEAGRHLIKLRRKGIASESLLTVFRPNRLHRFSSISGEDGLFAATERPLWFVSERGTPAVVSHKSRHVAPAGGRPVPVSGFSAAMPSVFQNASCGFLTLHERIGRIGSQRLTLYSGLYDVFSPHGVLPGGGICVQKVPLGVTVRHIEFIDDASVSTSHRPIYVMLISREIEADQSYLNDDGLSPEERQRIKDEKEAARVKKQVEADLGGFDIEQEWVEEIEREDCFEVDQKLGFAPSIPQRKYEVWLVDASSEFSVLDKYELDDFEHGTALKSLFLTNVIEDSDETPEKSLFVSVGTSFIDQDGEDLASKGRVLLFQVKKSKKNQRMDRRQAPLHLNLRSEKEITVGPVTSLSSLKSEDTYRVVVGAGAEVTVEQWGSGKLTQVGFYHAHMQVQEIVLFKTFFLLSDAYDSLHFLVWRESDKSLTLLAKDYEPTQVFAAGLISRGGAMAFVCHDDRQNLKFFQYAPADAEARGGNKLVCRADVHIGSQTTALQSHWCQSSLLFNSCTMPSTLAALKQQDALFGRLEDDQRFAVTFGTTDGSIGSIISLSEPVFWRLTALQSVMSNALESNCALSHRAWRLFRRSTSRGGCRTNDRKKGTIDGDLVMKFVDLALYEQEDLASSIGTTVGLLMDNLLEMQCASSII